MGRLQACRRDARADSGQRPRFRPPSPFHLPPSNAATKRDSTGEKMEIHLNISFPKIPCELLTLDVMDVSGEQQVGVTHGIVKTSLTPHNQGSVPIQSTALALHADEQATHLDPSYCGQCYGPPAPATVKKPGCCQTCDEVREAYASVGWAFSRGEGVEQCEREHYGEHLDQTREQGCRVEGGFRVNKVVGNFHIAPGRSFSNGMMHVHDLKNYIESPASHTFSHKIHHLRFGPQLPSSMSAKELSQWTNHHLNPLDDTRQDTDDPAFNYMYFVKVVSTSYLPLGWERKKPLSTPPPNDELVPLGLHGHGEDGSVETHQYSVTSHKRSLAGGSDSDEGHKERLHAQGGIPGVFISYDISPMKVINRETRPKTLAGFLTGVCAVIGGTLTVAAAVDRGVYEGAKRVNKEHMG